MAERPKWLAGLTNAVERWNGAGSGRGGDPAQESPSEKIGPAERSIDDPGWYSLVVRGRTIDTDRLEEAFLAPAEGPEKLKYGVRDAMLDGEVLHVHVASHAPQEGLFLWAARPGRGRLRKSMVDCLQKVKPEGVHSAFERRRPDPIESRRDVPVGLNPGQREAFRACMSPGLQLIWGPPGTGKTHVIAQAVEQLVREGKSVLLVSGTNVAVDNALLRAARMLGPDDAGVMIRVGTPHVPDVARDPKLSLNELRKRRAQHKEDQRRQIEDEIIALREHEVFQALRKSEARLDGFDPTEYGEALERVANGERLRQAKDRCVKNEAALAEQRERREDARRRLAGARDAWQRIQPHAKALQEAGELAAELESYRLQHARAASAARDAEEALETVEQALSGSAAGLSLRSSERRRKRDLRDRVQRAREALGAARTAEEQRKRILADAEPELLRRIEDSRARAMPITELQVEDLRESLQLRQEHYRTQEETYQGLDKTARANRGVLIALQKRPQPQDTDRPFIARVEAEDLPGLHRRLPGLRDEAAHLEGRIADLERHHEKLLEELRELGRSAEREIIASAKLVATTLDLLRLKRPVHERRYDVVIVDEAAASVLPAVIFGVSLAAHGAVLLGDFFQNAPIVDDAERLPEGPDRDWLTENCFSYFGMRRFGDADALPGCVELSEQYRFGESINDLANRIAYEGLLRVASRTRSEIVFVDVDGLGDEYSAVHPILGGSGRWWPVGALLARAVGEHHLVTHAEGQVGIVTPYRAQREAIQSLLGDGGPAGVEVNTSHGFQGREFDTVIFDLVEDGTGWMARAGAHGDAFAVNGLRLFNVAVTRARHRLYVIGNGTALARARQGPLQVLSEFIGRGTVEVVSAREVLGAPEPAIEPGPRFDVWDALRTYVKVVDLYDEDVLPAELLSYIKRAQHSIWIWSPWIGKRVHDFLPALEAAQNRGVKVRVLTRPAKQVAASLHNSLEAVRTRIRHVLCLWQEHQKLIVIDDQLVFMGSMNVLSHTGGSQGTRDIMTLIESRDFARHVLDHERADELSRMPTCPECGGRMWVVRLSRRPKAHGLEWWCRNLVPGADPTPCRHKTSFPLDPKGRNQPRPRR
ncbi:hypothetical protein GCM10023088_52110 [Actinomadura verrucosospora]|uniref:AAA domain-containing protein n=1 Tax=Actinomadura verrucosospora TaxID=46165 RepID=UPI0031EE8E3D